MIAGIATVLLKALVSVCIWLHTNQQAYSLICIFTVGKPNGCPSLISHLKQHGFFFFNEACPAQCSSGYCLFNFFIVMRLSWPRVYTSREPLDVFLICSCRAGGKVNHNIHPHCYTTGIIEAFSPCNYVFRFTLSAVLNAKGW